MGYARLRYDGSHEIGSNVALVPASRVMARRARHKSPCLSCERRTNNNLCVTVWWVASAAAPSAPCELRLRRGLRLRSQAQSRASGHRGQVGHRLLAQTASCATLQHVWQVDHLRLIDGPVDVHFGAQVADLFSDPRI